MFPSHRSKFLLGMLLFAGCAALLAWVTRPSPTTANALLPAQTVAQAWQAAQTSGSFQFRSTFKQTTYPLPSVRNAGRAPRTDQLALQGQTDAAAQRLELTLWADGSFNPATGMTLRVEDGLAYRRTATGEWTPDDTFAPDAFAPGGDPLGFLAGLKEIQAGETETYAFPGAASMAANYQLQLTPYTFTFDGPAFAAYMRAKLQAQLAARGALPPNLSLETPAVYKNMTGHGVVWVDTHGLPARLTLHLEYHTARGERIVADIQSDYASFDLAQAAQAQTSLWQDPGGWAQAQLRRWPLDHQFFQNLALVLVVLAFGLLLLSPWRQRQWQVALNGTLVLAFVLTPVLEGEQVYAFATQQQTRAADQAAQAEQIENQAHALAALRPAAETAHIQPQQRTGEAFAPTPPGLSAIAASTSTDTDGDGLTDDEEADWGTCPYLPNASAACVGVTDSTDSDGDGLGDGIEANHLTTLPTEWDTDGDTITDTLEVNGFSYAGQTWYLNPIEADSNKDGLIDAAECPVWVATTSTFNPAGVCPDTDGDGTPDAWDDDNDNDNVVDAVDLSVSKKSAQTFSDANPFQLAVSNLQPNWPVLVDVQFRPTDAEHLGYIGSVLDWPTGDTEGQIQRRWNTTFADTPNTSLQSTDTNAGYGDLKLTPLLEVYIPYTAGHYGNLPVNAAYSGTTRTLGVPVEDWLDQDALDAYGITVRDVDATSGDLVLYVPLSAVADDTGGGRVAFSARLLYGPQQTSGSVVNWGSAQQLRLIWLVQLLTDECINASADPDTCTRQDTLSVIHIYNDEWTLTGLEVREDRGLDVALIYEDPTQDQDLAQDDDIWAASWNLHNYFVRGRDCDSLVNEVCQSNGARDVTIANLASTLHTWSGNTDALAVETFSYDHQGYLAQVMMTETSALLDTHFLAYVTQTVPTLLFAREETYRSTNLNDYPLSGSLLSMNAITATVDVLASLSWATYDYADGAWANYDSSQNLARLTQQLAATADFQSTDPDVAEGKLLWAEIYYSALQQGLTAIVAIDGDPAWTADDTNIPEADYEADWPSSTFVGAGFVAFEYTSIFAVLSSGRFDGDSLFSALANGFDSPATTSYLRQEFRWAQGASNVLMGLTTMSTVVGLGLFAFGYFSGDSELQTLGVMILNATTLVMSVAWGVNMAVGLYAAAAQAAALGASRFSALMSVARASRAVGAAGLLLQVAAAWGVFIFQCLSGGLFNHPNSLAFNMALAYAIAGTIVALLLFILDLIPVVGTFIVLAIWIVDALLYFICDCQGFQSWLTEAIAESLYDVQEVISNFDSSDRLDLAFRMVTFKDDDLGFSASQVVTYTLDVTNTLAYGSDFSAGNAAKSTIRYYLQSNQTDRHNPLALSQMQDEWEALGGRKIRETATVTSSALSLSLFGTGINRDLTGKLYLTEAYVIPYAGCWEVFGIDINDCTYYPISGSTHFDVGQYQTYDVLPATLTDFFKLNWNSAGAIAFPAQTDPDADGLTSSTDANNFDWDSDNDGLGDYYEVTNAYDASASDSDADGLSDSVEVRHGTDPLDADTDDDGLNDALEWAGWRTSYNVDANGTVSYTWAWPDPANADADDDALNDLEEFYYGLNPQVATDADDILNTIQFADTTMDETYAPRLLARLEERSSATTFYDYAGLGHTLTCDADAAACPLAGQTGRFGAGLDFDGNDLVAIANSSSLNLGTHARHTVAVWFKVADVSLTSRKQVIYEQGGVSRGLNLYVYGGKLYGGGWNIPEVSWNGSFISTTIQSGVWYHAALVLSGTTTIANNALSLYLNGTLVGTASGAQLWEATDRVGLGAVNSATLFHTGGVSSGGHAFAGALDELVVFNTALTVSQIQKLYTGRYNVTDYVVTPGDTVDYSLVVSNTSANWPAAIAYYGQQDDTAAILVADPPAAQLPLNEAGGSTSFAINYLGGTATCAGPTTCPLTSVVGVQGNALRFDGDDEITADAVLSNWSGPGFSFGGWISATAQGQRYQTVMGVFKPGTGTTTADSVGYIRYDTVNREMLVYSGGGTGTNSVPANTWHHVMMVVDTLSKATFFYLDGVLLTDGLAAYNTVTSGGRFRLGGPTIAGSTNSGNFNGTIDHVTVYNRMLTAAEVVTVMNNSHPQVTPATALPQIYSAPTLGTVTLTETMTIVTQTTSASYRFRQLAEAALDIPDETALVIDPEVRVHFDEDKNMLQNNVDWSLQPYAKDPNDGTYTIQCGVYNYSTLDSTCPNLVNGLAGKSIQLNGTSQWMQFGVHINSQPWTIAAWIYPTHTVGTARGIFGWRNTTSGFPSLYIDSSDRLDFAFYANNNTWNTSYAAGGTVQHNQWQHVAVTYNGTSDYQVYLNGQAVGNDNAINTSLRPTVTTQALLGHISSTVASPFGGLIDNFIVYDVELSPEEIVGLYGINDLSLHLQYNFDEPPGDSTFTDGGGVFGDGVCTNCPIMGIRGAVNRAAYFDGGDQVNSGVLPAYWDYFADDFTVAAWVKADYGEIFENRSVNRPVRLWTDRADEGYCGGTACTDGYWDDAYPFTPLTNTAWTHVVIANDFNTNNDGLYVNGVKLFNTAGGSPDDGIGSNPVWIGKLLKGYLDDVRLYDRAFASTDVALLYQDSRPILQLEFEDATSSSVWEDQSPNGTDATIMGALPGLAGRVGYGGYFTGTNSYGIITPAASLGALTQTFTLMAWINPTQIASSQRIVAAGRDASDNGIGFGLSGNHLYFSTFGVQNFTAASTTVVADEWQHVAVVFDSNYDASFYINGTYIQTVAGTNPANTNFDDPFYIGAQTDVSGALKQQFNGQIDELYIYGRALNSAEIQNAYYNQFRWFRKQNDSYLTIDQDYPSIDLLTADSHWSNAYHQLVVGTSDPTSAIWSFEYGLKTPGALTYTWQGAPLCADAAPGAAWCPTFDPATLAGEGTYFVQFRVVDAVGNATTSAVHTLYVDDTPPTASSLYANTWLSATETNALTWALNLTGTVSDPTLSGGGSGSGVNPDAMTLALVDARNEILGGVGQRVSVTGTTWSLSYATAGLRPSGTYTVQVNVEDAVGNSATLNIGTVRLDKRPPAAQPYPGTRSGTVAITTSPIITGVAFDYADWADAVAQWHFEENSAAAFADYTGNANTLTCTAPACPASTTTSAFGRALDFDGVDDTLYVGNSSSLDIGPKLTLAAWVNPDTLPSGQIDRLLTLGNEKAGLRVDNLQLHFYMTLNGALYHLRVSNAVVTSTYQHVAGTYDGSTMRLYYNGLEQATLAVTGTVESSTSLRVNSSTEPFDGQMDEILVFNRALAADEVYALAQKSVSGVQRVEVWPELVYFNGTTAPENWQSATLSQTATAGTTWAYALPTGLENFYQLHLRATDAFSNPQTMGVFWRGSLDQLAPRLSVTATFSGSGAAAHSDYEVVIQDLFLDAASVLSPCDTADFIADYDFGNSGRLKQLTATCRISGIPTAPVTVRACDIHQLCTTTFLTPTTPPVANSVTLLAPENNAFINALTPQNVTIGAFAPAGIQALALSANGNPVSTTLLGGVTNTTWLPTWTPSVGTYSLTAVLTTTGGTVLTDAITVNVGQCYVETTGDNLADFSSGDASALQNAVTAAPAGAILKIAGYCAGVQASGGTTQTVLITQPVTLQGGYAPNNWVTPYPLSQTTTLDAQGGGRVISATHQLTLTNLTLQNGNSGNGNGGGAYVGGAAVLNNVMVLSNTASSGAGLFLEGPAVISNTVLHNNHATANGGGLAFRNAFTRQVVNTLLAGNTANGNGQAVYVETAGSNVRLLHTTLASPTLVTGAAVFVNAGNVWMTNTLIASHTLGLQQVSGTLAEDYTLFDTVTTPYSGNILSGGHALTGTAAFADTLWYTLTATSRAIDTGTNAGLTTDYFGNPRPQATGYDIGYAEAPFAFQAWYFRYLPVIGR